MTLLRSRAALISFVLFSLLHTARAAEPICRVVNLMPEYWRVVNASNGQTSEQQVQEFRKTLVAGHEDLYGKGGLGFDSAKQLDTAILRALDDSRRQESATKATAMRLEQNLPLYLASFKSAFHDFRCDFPIYIMHSLDRMDGAGRIVDGKPSLILGVDVIASEDPETLGILVHHELFHRYHFQVAGFSDDNAEHEVLWKGLWAEGLATYVSMKLNPSASMQDALLVPKDLVQRSQPLMPELVCELEPNLDRVDSELFSKFFHYRGPRANPPSRVGYYIGALAAQRMAKRHSLAALAHMPAEKVRKELSVQLLDIGSDASRN